MKQLYDNLSVACSKLTTRTYSTSFSMGIALLDKKIHGAIYSIYGFVRLADEIVDSFHGFEKKQLLDQFKADTFLAIDQKISLNPILNSFQFVVHKWNIDNTLIHCFLDSMEMDLQPPEYDSELYKQYILGSAEVVGLMCLKVFVNGDETLYQQLKPHAMSLGAAFQKINFLRDMQADYNELGRTYFPGVCFEKFSETEKQKIESDIRIDFENALIGIKQLPKESRLGVYAAYVYYTALFKKIKTVSAHQIKHKRIRISNGKKLFLTLNSMLKLQLKLV